MARLVLRRDRILLPVWLLVLAGVAASCGRCHGGDLPVGGGSPGGRRGGELRTRASPPSYGRIYDPSSLGGIAMLKMTAFGAVLVGVLMLLTS